MSSFLLFAIPSRLWKDGARKKPPDCDELLREQLIEQRAVWNRVSGGVNLESERGRFTSSAARIEGDLLARVTAAAATERESWTSEEVAEELTAGRLPVLRLDKGYLHMLVAIELARAESRTPGIVEPMNHINLGNFVFEPSALEPHLAVLEAEIQKLERPLPEPAQHAHQRRRDFLRALCAAGDCGVVEVGLPYSNHSVVMPAVERRPRRIVLMPPISLDEELDPTARRAGRVVMAERLDKEVKAAIKVFRQDGRGGKVNASNQPHDVTTNVLCQWVRRPGEEARIRIVYSDASEAAPFPMHVLRDRKPPDGEPLVIRTALMSMRHLDIDRIVDLAWFRNREVSQARSLAESDEFCFRYSLRELRSLLELSARRNQPIRLEVYHTGFEPASLGFYRALVTVLSADGSPQAARDKEFNSGLVVAPMYFKGGTRYEPSRDPDGRLLEWF